MSKYNVKNTIAFECEITNSLHDNYIKRVKEL